MMIFEISNARWPPGYLHRQVVCHTDLADTDNFDHFLDNFEEHGLHGLPPVATSCNRQTIEPSTLESSGLRSRRVRTPLDHLEDFGSALWQVLFNH